MFLKVAAARHKSTPPHSQMSHTLSRCYFHDGSVPMQRVMYVCMHAYERANVVWPFIWGCYILTNGLGGKNCTVHLLLVVIF